MPKLCILIWSVTGIAIPDEAVTYGQQKSGGIIVIQILFSKLSIPSPLQLEVDYFNLLHSNHPSLVMPGPILKLFTFLEFWDHSGSFELWTIHVGLV